MTRESSAIQTAAGVTGVAAMTIRENNYLAGDNSVERDSGI
jgi:hypothetical protein